MSKETGGPAFPNVPSDIQYENWDEGMTLRDYAAIKAMQGILSNTGQLDNVNDAAAIWVARDSYLMADAMLAERSKP